MKGKTPKSLYRPRSKYGAQPTVVDGIRFHSKREAARYGELKLLLRAGHIRDLKLQPRYALCALVVDGANARDLNQGKIANRRVVVAHYVADFEYDESDRGWGGCTWNLVVEDAKGFHTSEYQLKKRLFEAQYNVQIRET